MQSDAHKPAAEYVHSILHLRLGNTHSARIQAVELLVAQSAEHTQTTWPTRLQGVGGGQKQQTLITGILRQGSSFQKGTPIQYMGRACVVRSEGLLGT